MCLQASLVIFVDDAVTSITVNGISRPLPAPPQPRCVYDNVCTVVFDVQQWEWINIHFRNDSHEGGIKVCLFVEGPNYAECSSQGSLNPWKPNLSFSVNGGCQESYFCSNFNSLNNKISSYAHMLLTGLERNVIVSLTVPIRFDCRSATIRVPRNIPTVIDFIDYITPKWPGTEISQNLFVRLTNFNPSALTWLNGTSVNYNRYSLTTGFLFTSTSSSSSIKFKGESITTSDDKSCTLTIESCYERCKTCSSIHGNTSDNKCIECADGFYVFDYLDGKNCYTYAQIILINPATYWIPGTNIYSKCYQTCGRCYTGGTNEKHNCISCIDSYYFYEKQPTNCVNHDQVDDDYFLLDNYIFIKCYNTCGNCTRLGTDILHYCDECKPNHFHIEDIIGNCIELHTEPENYYLDHDKYFKKCPTHCQRCVKHITLSQKPTCLRCYEGHHFYALSPGICYPKRDIPWDTYYDELSNTYYKCHTTCKTCEIGGTETKHNCLTCVNNHYFIQDQLTNCSPIISGYYLDDSSNTLLKCPVHCLECNRNDSEKILKCTKCKTGFYFVESLPEICIHPEDIPDNFYLNGNTFYKCHETCKTCSNGTKYGCLQCLDGRHFWANGANLECITPEQKPSNYYLDGDIYRQCYSLCETCKRGGTPTAHFCSKCINTYYFKENDSNYNCMNTKPNLNYYLDSTTQTYRWCHSNCKTCFSGHVDNDKENCSSCKDKEYFIETRPTNCVNSDTTDVSSFYLDGWTYRKCHQNCETCIMGGSDSNNNCSKCKNGLHFIFTNPLHCIDQTSSLILSDYYLDSVANMYKKCGYSCATCEGTENNCLTCKSGYVKESVSSNNCVSSTGNDNFYLDLADNTLKRCYSSCYSCSQGGNNVSHNCLRCLNSTYHWTFDRVGNCITQDLKPVNYYLDTITDTYKPCHTNCYKCEQLGNSRMNLCTECIINFYFKEGEDTTTCFNRYDIPENYFIDNSVTKPIAKKCYYKCQSCNELGDYTNSKCTSCATGYYFKYQDTIRQCYSKIDLTNYYVDPDDNLLKQCYIGCQSCSQEGDLNKNEHYCTSCKSLYYPLEDKRSNCYKKGEQPDNYYYDTVSLVFRKCHENCSSCAAAGTDIKNNCITCASNFAFISTKPTNCIKKDTQPDDYFYDIVNNTYTPCYSTCGSCDKWGTSVRHECKSCIPNYSFIAWSPTNCIQQGTEPEGYTLNYVDNIYMKCYDKCLSCSDLGTSDAEMKCWSCYRGWVITTNKYKNGNVGNCIQPLSITQDNVDIDMFVPANDSEFIDESQMNKYHIKEVKVGMYQDSSIYYYLENKNISIIPRVSITEKCKHIWKKFYSLPSNTNFIVGQYTNNNILYLNTEIKNNSFQYQIYSDTGVNMDLVFCGANATSVQYRVNQKVSNINMLKEDRYLFTMPKWLKTVLFLFLL